MLSIDRGTVTRGIKSLVALGLMIGEYLRKPTPEVLTMIPDRHQGSKTWDVVDAVGWPFATMEHGPYLSEYVQEFTQQMLRAGIGRAEVLRYWQRLSELTERKPNKLLTFLELTFKPTLRAARDETTKNTSKGRFSGGNCFGLLLAKTEDVFKPTTSTASAPKVLPMPNWKTSEGPPGIDIEEAPTARQRYNLD